MSRLSYSTLRRNHFPVGNLLQLRPLATPWTRCVFRCSVSAHACYRCLPPRNESCYYFMWSHNQKTLLAQFCATNIESVIRCTVRSCLGNFRPYCWPLPAAAIQTLRTPFLSLQLQGALWLGFLKGKQMEGSRGVEAIRGFLAPSGVGLLSLRVCGCSCSFYLSFGFCEAISFLFRLYFAAGCRTCKMG